MSQPFALSGVCLGGAVFGPMVDPGGGAIGPVIDTGGWPPALGPMIEPDG